MMALLPFELRDRLPARAPLAKHQIALADELLEGVGGKNDFAVASRWPEENHPAPNFNARRLLSEVTMLVHAHISCAKSEQPDTLLTFGNLEAPRTGIFRPVSGLAA